MTMKTVTQSNEEEMSLEKFELAQRKLARTIFEEVFPNFTATPALIEAVSNKIVVTNEDLEIDKVETKSETLNLTAARVWAKEAYGDDSPAATLLAYDACNGDTEADRWNEVHDKLDEIIEMVEKKRK